MALLTIEVGMGDKWDFYSKSIGQKATTFEELSNPSLKRISNIVSILFQRTSYKFLTINESWVQTLKKCRLVSYFAQATWCEFLPGSWKYQVQLNLLALPAWCESHSMTRKIWWINWWELYISSLPAHISKESTHASAGRYRLTDRSLEIYRKQCKAC